MEGSAPAHDGASAPMPYQARRYLISVCLLGAVACVVAVSFLGLPGITTMIGRAELYVLVALALIGELRPVMSRGEGQGANTSTTFTVAATLVFGWPVGLVLQALASGLAGLIHRHAWWRTLFNMAQQSVAMLLAGLSLWLFDMRPRVADPTMPRGMKLFALVLAGLVYFGANHYLVWQAMALSRGGRLRDLVKRDGLHQLVVTGTMIALAPLIGIVTTADWWLLPLFIPVLVALHRSASSARERERLALHDPLTRLPNRTMLLRHAEDALAEANRSGDGVALFLLDLDRFKEVNETLGHLAGDELLRQVARRVSRAVRDGGMQDGDVVARLGGDEFAVLLPRVSDLRAARELARPLSEAFTAPFVLHGLTIALEVSIGIALHPDHGSDFETLLARADVAMYQAKRLRTGVSVYEAVRDRNTPDRLALLHDLRRALDNRDVGLHYQPKVAFTGGVVGFEALVRWNHPTRGAVSPEDFVGLAEQTGLMPRLTAYVIDVALRQASVWWREGLAVPVAVNMSVRDIHAPGFVARVQQGLLRYGVPPAALVLEITERVLLEDPDRAQAVFSSLDSLGVRLSVDDFGTGYSSLLLLRRVPVSEIKIDRSFVSRLTEGGDDAVIVRSTVDLAHSLGLHVVAEGVEDTETWDKLATLGCDVAQGWLISRAMTAGAATTWLRQQVRRPYGSSDDQTGQQADAAGDAPPTTGEARFAPSPARGC